MNRISIITASNGENLKLAHKFREELENNNQQCEVFDLVDIDLPMFTPKRKSEEGVPAEVAELLEKFKDSKSFVFVAPEYNGGIPPVLTNLFSWISISTKDWREAFNEKKAVMATHSGSGGINLFASLRIQLAYIGIDVVGRQIHTHYKKSLNTESLTAVCKRLV